MDGRMFDGIGWALLAFAAFVGFLGFCGGAAVASCADRRAVEPCAAILADPGRDVPHRCLAESGVRP